VLLNISGKPLATWGNGNYIVAMTAIVSIKSIIPEFGSVVLESDTTGEYRLKNVNPWSPEVLEQAYEALRTLDRVAMVLAHCHCTKFRYMVDFPEPNPLAFVLPHIRAGLSHRDAVLVRVHTPLKHLGRITLSPTECDDMYALQCWLADTCANAQNTATKARNHARNLAISGIRLPRGRFTRLSYKDEHMFRDFANLDRTFLAHKEVALLAYAENTELGRTLRGIIYALADLVWQVQYFGKYPELMPSVGYHVMPGILAITTEHYQNKVVSDSCTQDTSVYAYTRHGDWAWVSVQKDHMSRLANCIKSEYSSQSNWHQSYKIKVDYAYYGDPVSWYGIEFHWGKDDIKYRGFSTSLPELETMLAEQKPSTAHAKAVELRRAVDLY
jgi:hypothetical protein